MLRMYLISHGRKIADRATNCPTMGTENNIHENGPKANANSVADDSQIGTDAEIFADGASVISPKM